MYNWSVDLSKVKKHSSAYRIFKLEQQINFGLKNSKLSLSALKKYWNKLVIDPSKKAYLQKIIWR